MARTLTAGMITELTGKSLSPAVFIKAEFDSADLNLWSGVGDMIFNGDTYLGAGNFLSMSRVVEAVNLEANGVNFTLSGLPSSFISLALNEAYQGRFISAWFGCLDSSGALISTPYMFFKGRMDVLEVMDSGDTATFTIRAESVLIDFRRVKVRRFTDEDQKSDYPTDKGMEHVDRIQDREFIWGRANPK